MSQPVVIDNSIVTRWFHPSGTPTELALADIILNAMEMSKISPVAPLILTMEFSNALHCLDRRGELEGQIGMALMYWEHLGFEVLGSDYHPSIYMQALSELCSKYALSAYDAAYLELAIRKNYPLMTLDKKLKKAATQSNLLLNIKDL